MFAGHSISNILSRICNNSDFENVILLSILDFTETCTQSRGSLIITRYYQKNITITNTGRRCTLPHCGNKHTITTSIQLRISRSVVIDDVVKKGY